MLTGPAPICAMQYMNDGRYLSGDEVLKLEHVYGV